eukprot:4609632-Prymnesium_polylepis.1
MGYGLGVCLRLVRLRPGNEDSASGMNYDMEILNSACVNVTVRGIKFGKTPNSARKHHGAKQPDPNLTRKLPLLFSRSGACFGRKSEHTAVGRRQPHSRADSQMTTDAFTFLGNQYMASERKQIIKVNGPCRAVPGRAGPCRAVPCRAVPCRAVPCRA